MVVVYVKVFLLFGGVDFMVYVIVLIDFEKFDVVLFCFLFRENLFLILKSFEQFVWVLMLILFFFKDLKVF